MRYHVKEDLLNRNNNINKTSIIQFLLFSKFIELITSR